MTSFLDLQFGYRELQPQIDGAVARVLDSGSYIGGKEVEAFEEEWASYCGAEHCVGVGNGLDALTLALRACDIGPGDGVIVPSNTYIASWLAVSAVGARIQPVEPDPATYNIDPSRIAAAITPETRAIMPVHLYGQPVDLDPILSLANEYGLRVVEDAAQAHGARYKQQRIGAHSDVVCWSFYPGKNLGAMGDAGAVTTNDQSLAGRIRRFGNYGSDRKYVNVERGTNTRLDPLQAAILRVKLTFLDKWTERRRSLAAAYHEVLADTCLTLPRVPEWAEPVWHLYVVRTPKRDALQTRLAEAGVETLIHYPIAPHMQAAYSDLRLAPGDLPVAKWLAGEVLSLPMGPHLRADRFDELANTIKRNLVNDS